MPRFEGIIPPMITPFRPDGQIDEDAFLRNVRIWNGENLGGYLALGSNSETPFLQEEEKLRLITLTVEHAREGRTILAGTGLESTRDTVRLTNRAAELGVHAALVLPPSYYGPQMNADALLSHFRKVADASRIPVLLYNVPKFTHLNIPDRVVESLAGHSNIVGMKDSSGDVNRLASLIRNLPPAFHLIAGTGSIWYPALTLGIRCGIMAIANFAGGLCCEVARLHGEGKEAEARMLYFRLLTLDREVAGTYGVAGLKYAAGLCGYAAGEVRSPLLPLGGDAREAIRRVLEKAGVLPQG